MLLQTSAGNAAVSRAVGRYAASVQRYIKVGGRRVNAQSLYPLLAEVGVGRGTTAHRLLQPIVKEWLSGGEHEASNETTLRTQLIVELSDRWTRQVAAAHPTLARHLAPDAFRTIVYQVKLASFDARPFESALDEAVRAPHVDHRAVQKLVDKWVKTEATFAVFTRDFRPYASDALGLVAELVTATSVDPTGLRPGRLVGLANDYRLTEPIGGRESQDADVSFVTASGGLVLVEVAATVDRLRAKMGPDYEAQRRRYADVRRQRDGLEIAYSVPGVPWWTFFQGAAGTAIAERLGRLDPAWGLLLEGRFVSPDDLGSTMQRLRDADDRLGPGTIWGALQASRLSLREVTRLDAKDLAKRLRRHV